MAKGPTIPKPFNLSQGNKRKLEEAASEYISLAQQVENFQKRTPPRYHLRSRKEDEGKEASGFTRARSQESCTLGIVVCQGLFTYLPPAQIRPRGADIIV